MRRKGKFSSSMLGWIVSILVAVFVSLFIISNIISFTMIMEVSMEPTLYENDRVLVNRIGYMVGKPKREDVVILNKVNDEKGIIKNMVNEGKDIIDNIKFRFTGEIEKNNLIKRVVAVEGDIVDIRDGNLYINGIVEENPSIRGDTYAYDLEFPIEVPKDKVFTLGDNREFSLDSRHLGFIDIGQVKGKAVFRVLPFDSFGRIK